MKRNLQWVCKWVWMVICLTGVLQAEEWGLKPGGKGKLPRAQKVLLAGDSLMHSLGPQLCTELGGFSNLTLIPIGKSSTGLARADFYDWPRVLEEHLRSDRPQVVVMWVGTNDPQPIYNMPSAGEVGSETWQAAYQGKIAEIVRLSQSYGAHFVLMGPPVLRSEKTDEKLAMINRLMYRVCRRAGVPFIDTRAALSDTKGRYCPQARMPDGSLVPIRTPDGVHITAEGNRIVMKYLLPCLGRIVMKYTPVASPTRGSRGITGRGSVRGVTVRSGNDRSYRGSTTKSPRRR